MWRELGRIGVDETGWKWKIFGNCEVLDWMGEWAGGERGCICRLGGGDSWL